MSVKPTIVNCSICNFKSSFSRTYGQFKYLLPNNSKITAERTIGWCHSCNNISTIELFPDASILNNDINNIKRELNDLTRFSIRRLFPSTSRNIDNLKSKLPDLENTLLFLNIRKGPPLCLLCGSKDVFQIDFSSHEKEIQHPGCGGKLMTHESKIRFSFRLRSRLYDVEGNKIEESDYKL